MHRGIITVTLSPSIDVTLWLDGLRTDEANRVTDESRGVGGKGINVSRVVQSYGLDNLCLAVAGEGQPRRVLPVPREGQGCAMGSSRWRAWCGKT